ncbi:hypothetical protein Lser_V15G15159 [Lactuca serriola]
MANIGNLILDEEVIGYILASLGPGHGDLFTAITVLRNQHTITLHELYSYLIAHEAQSSASNNVIELTTSANHATLATPLAPILSSRINTNLDTCAGQSTRFSSTPNQQAAMDNSTGTPATTTTADETTPTPPPSTDTTIVSLVGDTPSTINEPTLSDHTTSVASTSSLGITTRSRERKVFPQTFTDGTVTYDANK